MILKARSNSRRKSGISHHCAVYGLPTMADPMVSVDSGAQPVSSHQDSCPQGMLNVLPPNSLDYSLYDLNLKIAV